MEASLDLRLVTQTARDGFISHRALIHPKPTAQEHTSVADAIRGARSATLA